MLTDPKELPVIHLLTHALARRIASMVMDGASAVRLFNGFSEGYSDLSIDLYGKTLLIFNNADEPASQQVDIQSIVDIYTQSLPWVEAVLVKERHGKDNAARKGKIIWGDKANDRILENSVWYALDLQINRDASFYLDTRYLRLWALENLAGKSVLNTFAYTGSLGVAARVGGANQVIHLDQSKVFLNLAKQSYRLNHLSWKEGDFITGNFFTHIRPLKDAGTLFDCVFIDPPYFSTSPRGRVDLNQNSASLINKVRPLVAHNGWLVTVNNALFVAGEAYYRTLQELCMDGYMSIETLIPVPEDCTGYPETIRRALPANPAPFNHATKIAILRVKRKDQRLH